MELSPILDLLLKHKSVRKYKDTPISAEALKQILEAGERAATTGNMQLYSVIVTKDEERKRALAPLHFNQPMITEAPIVLTFVADVNRFQQWCEQRQAGRAYDNFLWYICAVIDTALMAQNTVIAAEAMGIGSCYLGTTLYMARELSEFFDLPQGVIPITTITMGYPAENPELTDRLPLNGIMHEEKYNPYSEEDIDKIFAYKESLPDTQSLIMENMLPNLAQIFTLRRYPIEDNLKYTRMYLDLLKAQGYWDESCSVGNSANINTDINKDNTQNS